MAKRNQEEQERQQSEAGRDRRDIVSARGALFFDELKRSSEKAVNDLKTAAPHSSRFLWFMDRNVFTFELKRLDYPAVWKEVTQRGDLLVIKTTTQAEANAEVKESSERLPFELDEQEKFHVVRDGRRLAGINDATELILRPLCDR